MNLSLAMLLLLPPGVHASLREPPPDDTHSHRQSRGGEVEDIKSIMQDERGPPSASSSSLPLTGAGARAGATGCFPESFDRVSMTSPSSSRHQHSSSAMEAGRMEGSDEGQSRIWSGPESGVLMKLRHKGSDKG